MATAWQKAFQRIFWKNRPSTDTPVGESKLLPMDASIDTIDDRVVTLQSTKAEQSDFLTAIKNIQLNDNTGVFTITRFNDSTFTIDSNLEKISTNWVFIDNPSDPYYEYLRLTLADGTYQYVDLRKLITQYEFGNTATINFAVSSPTGIVTANIINGSITYDHLAPALQTIINGAESYSEESEAWAVGQKNGTDVPSTADQYHNNSKYYAQQAAAALANIVTSFNGRNGAVVPTKGDYDITKITPTNGAVEGQIPILTNVGTAESPDLEFRMQNIPSSGHTIMDASGSSLAFQPTMQFNGLADASNDDANQKTVVHVPNPVGYGTCTAVVDNYEQTVVLPGYERVTGSIVSVLFDHDVYKSGSVSPRYKLSLNVNNTGKADIKVNGQDASETIVKANTIGVFQFDGTYFNLIASQTIGGHIIYNSSNSQMIEREKLRFKDAHLSDSGNFFQSTDVEIIKEVADISTPTADGIYVCDDGNDVPIGNIEEDYVEVEGDGSKTLGQLLNEIYARVDISKISSESYIIHNSAKFSLFFKTENAVCFTFSLIDVGVNLQGYTLRAASSKTYVYDGSTVLESTSQIPTSGTKISLHYGTSSSIINLLTDANGCMMSNGQSVEQAITRTESNIAPIETGVASKSYAVGDQFILNGLLYKATAAINSGGAIVPNGNCELSKSITEQMMDFPFTVLADIAITVGTTASVDKTGCKFLIAQLLVQDIVIQNLIFPANYHASFELVSTENDNTYAAVVVALGNTNVRVVSSASAGWSNLHIQIIGVK